MKMKLLISLFFLSSYHAFSQQKITLTKEETINYIDKNLKEGIGHSRIPKSSGQRLYFLEITLKKDNDLIKVNIERSNFHSWSQKDGNCDFFSYSNWDRFNPKHIIKIEEDVAQDGATLGLIKLTLISKVAIENQKAYNFKQTSSNGSCYDYGLNDEKELSVDVMYIPFLNGDPSNFSKLKKVFEHLSQLYKTENDPFAN